MVSNDASGASPFKYDVAFSFMARDEGLAEELSRLLAGRFETFIYSHRALAAPSLGQKC